MPSADPPLLWTLRHRSRSAHLFSIKLYSHFELYDSSLAADLWKVMNVEITRLRSYAWSTPVQLGGGEMTTLKRLKRTHSFAVSVLARRQGRELIRKDQTKSTHQPRLMSER
jgi:hypothetical protein